MTRQQMTFDLFEEPARPPSGLVVVTEVIDAAQEAALIAEIDARPWMTSMNRRVQHWGWRYDYKTRDVPPSAYLGPLPAYLVELAEQVQAHTGFVPDQAIVNEYLPGQGIGRHLDCEPCFGPVIASVSLAADVQMDFTAGPVSIPVLVERRSLLVMSGPARYEWSHEIAKRQADPLFGIKRARRLSITFRNVVH